MVVLETELLKSNGGTGAGGGGGAGAVGGNGGTFSWWNKQVMERVGAGSS